MELIPRGRAVDTASKDCLAALQEAYAKLLKMSTVDDASSIGERLRGVQRMKDEYERQLKRLSTALKTLRAQSSIITARIDLLKDFVSINQSKTECVTSKKAEFDLSLSITTTETESLEQERKETETAVESISVDIFSTSDGIREIYESALVLQQSEETEVQRLDLQIAEIESISTQLANSRKQLSDESNKHFTLEAEDEALEDRIKDLQAQIESKTKSNESLQSTIDTKNREMRSLKLELTSAETGNKSTCLKIQQAMSCIQELERNLEETREIASDRRKLLEQFLKEIETIQNSTQTSQEELNSLEKLDSNEQLASESKEKLAAVDEIISQLSDQIDIFGSKLKKKMERRLSLEETYTLRLLMLTSHNDNLERKRKKALEDIVLVQQEHTRMTDNIQQLHPYTRQIRARHSKNESNPPQSRLFINLRID